LRRLLSSDAGRWLPAAACVLILMGVPAAHAYAAARLGPTAAYNLGSAIFLACAIGVIWACPRPLALHPSDRATPLRLTLGALAALVCCYWTASRLLPAIFSGPIDVYRGDMLVLVESGVKEFLAGRTPYRMYHLPWDAPLSYGPVLWLPYAIPIVGRFDLRVLPLAAYLVVVAAGLVTSALTLSRHRIAAPSAIAVLAVALAAQPQIAAFYPIAHTPVYWPLLIVFCLALNAERWVAAAALLGLLIAARTTMVSVAPIFLLAAYRRQRLTAPLVIALLLTSIGPFVPFFVREPQAVLYGMVGVYPHTIKEFIWRQTDAARTTYGVTAPLLRLGLERYVEAAQVLCLLAVYGASWRPLARGARPEPWMALALLVFSMTTLWPVLYVYFDVWVFLIAGLVAASFGPLLVSHRPRQALVSCVVVVAVAVGAVCAAGARQPGSSYTIDVGTREASALTGGGFGKDEPSYDGGREFVWVTDGAARVRLPRASWTAADVAIDIRPFEPVSGMRQTVSASLNGKPIGFVTLDSGWQRISFHAQRRYWNYGFNVLELYFAYAIPEGSSDRKLSAGIDRVEIH
jgi:hypothetical protein